MHAVTRMDAREVREDDVRSVARTAVECRWQEANATWRLTGQSAEGDRLVVVLGAHATGLRLVTV